MWRFVVKFDAVNSRVARLSLRCHGNPVHLFSVYAPHSSRPSCDKEQFLSQFAIEPAKNSWCRGPIHFRRFQCKIAFCTRWGPSTGRTPCLGQRLWFFKQRIPQHSWKSESFCRFFEIRWFLGYEYAFPKTSQKPLYIFGSFEHYWRTSLQGCN